MKPQEILAEPKDGTTYAGKHANPGNLRADRHMLSGPSVGLGAMWDVELEQLMLGEAGFTSVEVVDSPRPQNCIFICRKGGRNGIQ